MKTVADLRRSLEGVTDETPLALEFLDDDQLTRMPVGEIGLLLNGAGTGNVFVLETTDTVTFAEMRTRLHRSVSEAEAAGAQPVLYGQLALDFRFLASEQVLGHPLYAETEARFKRSLKTLLGIP